ncbi:SDR family oxidoreductase [Saccharomonospora sp. NPDC046836]|uniref:SDR family oxidoreductase n=1 Tax=Saccharomonospora sp. NPDC046836 TaxID=3156921 RepID=UPI00340A5705
MRTASIVNVSSAFGARVLDHYAVIGVSKAALEALTRYQAVEYAPHGVRVNTVSAPMIDNRVAALFPHSEAMLAATLASTPGGRLTTEEDLARLVLLAASPDAGWVTGQTLVADGGLSLDGIQVSTRARRPDTATQAEPTPDAEDAIAVVGMGVVAPGADGVDEFWDRLCRGEPAFTEPDERFPLADFHSDDPDAPDRTYALVGGVIHEPGRPDPDNDYAAEWLRRALREAAATTQTRPVDRHSLFAGIWADGSQHLEESIAVGLAAQGIAEQTGDPEVPRTLLREHYPRASRQPGEHTPDRIARAAARGVLPEDTSVFTVDTVCSSSLYAIDLGVRTLLDGEADIAYCGGTFTLCPRTLVLFAKLRGWSPTGALRSFDAAADGTIFSDAAGVVALKRLSRAKADGDEVLAVLTGFGGSADGRGTAIYAPNPAGQRLALRRAHEINRLRQDDVDLVVAHATGTVAGDSAELAALATEAGAREVLCVSNKTLFGHGGWAAGVLSVIHAILCLQHERIPAQPAFAELPEPANALPVRVPTHHVPFPRKQDAPRIVGVSSFGFGGTDAHVLLQDPAGSAPPSARPAIDDELVLVAWSAHLPGNPSRDTVAERLADGLAPAAERRFGEPYPEPPFAQVRMSRKTARAIDRCQLMALQATDRFADEHGALWDGMTERTGVFCAHADPTRASMEATARSYAHGIERVLADRPEADTYAQWLAGLRRTVPPTSEGTMPGVMANVIPARIANQLDLRGLTMTLDSGIDSGLAALHAASAYLRRGDLDLALVLGIHGNTLRLGPGPETAEGAFLLAVTRAGVARDRGWPVLAQLRTHLRPPAQPDVADIRHVAAGRPSYGGADSLLAVLHAANRPGAGVTVRGEDTNPSVDILPAPAAGQRAPERDEHRQARRHRAVFRPAPPLSPDTATIPAIPPHYVVLAGSAGLAAALAEPVGQADGILVSVDPAAAPHATVITEVDEHSLDSVLRQFGGAAEHIRLFCDFSEAAWPAPPGPGLLALQDLLLVACKHSHARLAAGGSMLLALLDPAHGGHPHPNVALFTGFVKSLAWELPQATIRALVTDSPAIPDILAELAAESGSRLGLPVVHRHRGSRLTERIELLPSPSPTATTLLLDKDCTVVAVGGARGITAAVLTALLRRCHPRVWVLGSLDLAAFDPHDLATPAEELHARRAAHIAHQRKADPSLSVAQINRGFQRLCDANEAWHNLRRLTELAGPDRVHYLHCDITDPAALSLATRQIGTAAQRVDLLINGAGQHHAAGIAAKTLEEFRRVRTVKVLGYCHLRAAFAELAPHRGTTSARWSACSASPARPTTHRPTSSSPTPREPPPPACRANTRWNGRSGPSPASSRATSWTTRATTGTCSPPSATPRAPPTSSPSSPPSATATRPSPPFWATGSWPPCAADLPASGSLTRPR